MPRPSTGTADLLCWTRMQAESGQQLDEIVRRKEIERAAGRGEFWWGVGNPPPRSLTALARTVDAIPIVFSIMKGRPRPVDVAPPVLLVWRRFIDVDGAVRALPPHALVTSRGGANGSKRAHYALVCRSDRTLALGDYGAFDPSGFRNHGGSGAPVGASQVTALLRRSTSGPSADGGYRVNLFADLAGPFWTKLVDPVLLDGARRGRFERDLKHIDATGWLDFVAQARTGASEVEAIDPRGQLSLL